MQMYIGEVANQSGASPKAIRHYEVLGLLSSVPRAGTYRIYSPSDVMLIRLIKQAQSLGFRLSELKDWQLTSQAPNWAKIMEAVEQKRNAILGEIEQLKKLDHSLEGLGGEIRTCLESSGTQGVSQTLDLPSSNLPYPTCPTQMAPILEQRTP